MNQIITLMLAISFIMPQTNTHAAPKPTHDSSQLRVEDMLMLFLIPNIYEVVGDFYYPHILKLKPEIEPWHITVVETNRLNGFRGFLLSITIEVEPTLGHHVPVGKDRITYQVSYGPSAKMVNYTHLATYELPSDLHEYKAFEDVY